MGKADRGSKTPESQPQWGALQGANTSSLTNEHSAIWAGHNLQKSRYAHRRVARRRRLELPAKVKPEFPSRWTQTDHFKVSGRRLQSTRKGKSDGQFAHDQKFCFDRTSSRNRNAMFRNVMDSWARGPRGAKRAQEKPKGQKPKGQNRRGPAQGGKGALPGARQSRTPVFERQMKCAQARAKVMRVH